MSTILILGNTPVIPISIYKPIIMILVLLLWAHWVTILDKEAATYFLKRRWLNAMLVISAAFAYLLWLAVPFFWVGFLITLIILASSSTAFAVIRNRAVPEINRWTFSMEFVNNIILQRKMAAAANRANLRFVVGNTRSNSGFKPVPTHEDPNFPIHLALGDILDHAFEKRAQRVEFAIGNREVAIGIVVDGVRYPHESPPDPATSLNVVNYIKSESGMDPNDNRRKQTGSCRVDSGELGQHEITVSAAGSTKGITCILDIDPHEQLGIQFSSLGLLESQINQLKPVLADNARTIVVSSPPGQGRSTTLYALLQMHDPYMMDIHTLEPEIEHDVEGVTQHTPGEETMTKALNSLLLRDPQVVLLSHVTEKELPRMIAKAALDEKRVYVGIRADDTMSAAKSWAQAVGDLKLTANSLAAITCQRLMRKLCPMCRQAYKPEPEALKKLNLPADKVAQMFKASGKVMDGNKEIVCPKCRGLGYFGQTAAFELMIFDDAARQFLAAGDLKQLRNHLRKNKMLIAQEAALAKAVNGETSVTEVMRVFGNK